MTPRSGSLPDRQLADPRVQDRFERRLGRRVGEDPFAHSLPVERAIGADVLVAEPLGNRRDRRAAGRGQRVGNGVAVDDRGALQGEHVGHCCLSAADAPGETDRESDRLRRGQGDLPSPGPRAGR